MTIYEHLRGKAEPMPAWLAGYTDSAPFPCTEFFQCRIVFYPGSGNDGHAVKVFGSTHAVHCFVYADFSASQEMLEKRLAHPVVGFLGYRTAARRQLLETDLSPRGWTPHIRPMDLNAAARANEHILPFGFLEVLEREADFSADHGPRRLYRRIST